MKQIVQDQRLLDKRLVVFIVAIAVWLNWLFILSPNTAFATLFENWEIALTMAFGSIVAGATSVGGGAVAFPVFTKVLEISPDDAKAFSLAIQSVGMSAAAITIIVNKITVDWKIIRWGSLGGLIGIWLGLGHFSSVFTPSLTKFSFTLILSSFALVLLFTNQSDRRCHSNVPIWTLREQSIVLGTSIFGGVMSGLVGNGIDIVVFAIMVLLFRINEKVATPTSVILMAINAFSGLVLEQFVFQSFVEPASSYFVAAIPVVVVGAPLGALLCQRLSRQTIVNILVSLIAIEFFSSMLLIPLHFSTLLIGIGILLVFSFLNYRMYQSEYYDRPVNSDSEDIALTVEPVTVYTR
ncbi:MAG: sulfite exporter TauE/SafE family protein [Cyanobacteria bacterium P01_F01_bin.150]